ncbi:MAG: hypothetical protein ACYDH1_19950, partial [Anaerolineaceae bacterium]
KFLTSTLSLVLPVASTFLKVVDDATLKTFENQLDLSKNVIDAIVGEGNTLRNQRSVFNYENLENGLPIRADNSSLRELHSLLYSIDAGYGGLIRVINKHEEFLWVHPKFKSEY